MDSNDKQVFAVNLNRLGSYKDYIYTKFKDEALEYSSVEEIMKFKDLMERGSSSSQALN